MRRPPTRRPHRSAPRPPAWSAARIALLLLLLLGPRPASAEDPEHTRKVFVGIVAAEDFADEFARWRDCLLEVASRARTPFRFYLAPGTYGDLVHWMERGLIDLAVVTPGVYMEARDRPGAPIYDYVATVDMLPARGDWAVPARREARHHFDYHAVCVAAAASPVETMADVEREAARGRVKFIFVDPLSLSGHLAPAFALDAIGIRPSRREKAFTYSHTNALRHIAAQPPGIRSRVGFVWDDAIERVPELKGKLRRIPFPALDGLVLPHDAILVRRGFARSKELAAALKEASGSPRCEFYAPLPDHAARYDTVRRFAAAAGEDALAREAQAVSLDELTGILLHAARAQVERPRLALVLSGGGAKCAYQAGAVAAIEERLEKIREFAPECQIDIDLVVGTSGGAINAVPIALGIGRTAEGRDDLRDLWRGLDQREVVRPSPFVRGALGLWTALLALALLLPAVRRIDREGARRARLLIAGLALLCLAGGATSHFAGAPWRLLGERHILHHLLLWLDYGVRAAWLPLLLSLPLFLLADARVRARGGRLRISRGMFRLTLLLVLTLPAVQIAAVLFFQETLSGGEGMEKILADRYGRILSRHLERLGGRPPDLRPDAPPDERIVAMSRDIMGRGLLERELVITATCIDQSRGALPTDIYFHTWSPRDRVPPFGPRGVLFDDYPHLLLDVILGSSTIFPVFPARRLRDIPAPGDTIDLVDGGFAHNSPIEAAVLRGATHILLIESTPAPHGRRDNLVGNIGAAFAHLHRQSQLVDLRSKRHVVVFTLTPERQPLCVLCFADNMLERALEQGDADARGLHRDGGELYAGRASFRKELGEPVFTEIVRAAKAPEKETP